MIDSTLNERVTRWTRVGGRIDPGLHIYFFLAASLTIIKGDGLCLTSLFDHFHCMGCFNLARPWVHLSCVKPVCCTTCLRYYFGWTLCDMITSIRIYLIRLAAEMTDKSIAEPDSLFLYSCWNATNHLPG